MLRNLITFYEVVSSPNYVFSTKLKSVIPWLIDASPVPFGPTKFCLWNGGFSVNWLILIMADDNGTGTSLFFFLLFLLHHAKFCILHHNTMDIIWVISDCRKCFLEQNYWCMQKCGLLGQGERRVMILVKMTHQVLREGSFRKGWMVICCMMFRRLMMV